MKAILVIDMPSECIYCPCYRQSSSYEWGLAEDCKAMLRPIDAINRPEWCPLKQMPDKAAEVLVKGLDAMEKMESVEVRTVRRTE